MRYPNERRPRRLNGGCRATDPGSVARRRGVRTVTAIVALFASAGGAAFGAPRAEVEGEVDGSLRAAIEDALGETPRPAQTSLEARRRAETAAEDAATVLRSQGYYAFRIESEVRPSDPPRPVIRIVPGPRFAIEAPGIDWVQPEPTAATQAAGRAALDLRAGAPAQAAEVVAAEARLLATVQARGYADAQARKPRVVVDHASLSLQPTFRIASGPLVKLNGVELDTSGVTSPHWVQGLAPWRSGDVYAPDPVAELERRLLDTGVFESVTVALRGAEAGKPNGARPVLVSLVERPRRTISVGATYASTDGLGADAKWTHRNLLHRADSLILGARVATIDSGLDAQLALPHWRRPQQMLKLGASARRLRTDAYDETGAGLRADIERRFGKTSMLTYGVSLDYSRERPRRPDVADIRIGRNTGRLAGLVAGSLDRSDDPLDPRRGWRVEGRAEPTILVGNRTAPYARLQGQGSAYLPLDPATRTVLAGRLTLGSIVGSGSSRIPASRRFYAGGGGSVRGYPYQSVGPRLADETPRGGLSLMEAAFEARHRIGDRLEVVAFVDGGAVGPNATPTLDGLSFGAGIGVRYDLGFGPIRADVATPLNPRRGDPAIQVYLSIGQSF